MAKKKDSSPSVTPMNKTPKVVFKRTNSPNKKAKKHQLSPSKKTAPKKNNATKNAVSTSHENIVESKNPSKVSKEKKKKPLSDCIKGPKSLKIKQVKEKVKPSKNTCCDELTKIGKVKNSKKPTSDVGKKHTNKKTAKAKDVCNKVTKKKKEGSANVTKKMLSKVKNSLPSKTTKPGKVVKRTSSKDSSVGLGMTKACGRSKIGRPTKCKNKEVNSVVVLEEATSVIPMEEAAALVEDATSVTPVEGAHMSPVSDNYSTSDSIAMSHPPEELSEPIVCAEETGDDHSLGINSEACHSNPDDDNELSPPLSPSLYLIDWDCELPDTLPPVEEEDQDMVDLMGEEEFITKTNTELINEFCEEKAMEIDFVEEAGQLVKENTTKMDLVEEAEAEDKAESDNSIENTTRLNFEEEESKPVDVEESQRDDESPEIETTAPFITPEKYNSPSNRSTIEDDLCLSTSLSQCSSRSSVSLSSVDGLFEMSKIRKRKKGHTDLSSLKLPLKRKEENINIDEKLCKIKCLDRRESCPISNSSKESVEHSRPSEEYKRRGSERSRSNSRASDCSSNCSPSKDVKVLVKRVDEKECVNGTTNCHLKKQGNKNIDVPSTDMIKQVIYAPGIQLKVCSVSLSKIDNILNTMDRISPSSQLEKRSFKKEDNISLAIDSHNIIFEPSASKKSGSPIKTMENNLQIAENNKDRPPKKPQLKKGDLLKRRQQLLSSQTGNLKARNPSDCLSKKTEEPITYGVDTICHSNTILSRRIVLNNKENPDSSLFKIPQVLDNRSSNTEINVKVNEHSVENRDDNEYDKDEYCEDEYNEDEYEDDEDDAKSAISLFVADDTVEYIDGIAKDSTSKGLPKKSTGSWSMKSHITAQGTYIDKIFSGTPKNKITFDQIPLRDEVQGPKNTDCNSQVPYQETSADKTNNKLPRNITVINPKNINRYSQGEFQSPMLINNQITKEDQTGLEFPPPRSRSNSSLSDSNYFYGSDNIAYENLLSGTPFDGYCIFYLRNSVVKNHEHHCDMKHEVPVFLFQPLSELKKDEFKKSTVKGINQICNTDCKNPPLKLLDGITCFYTKNEQKHELKNLIIKLKNSISVRNVGPDKYKEVWTHFTKRLVRNIDRWNPRTGVQDSSATIIDFYLQTIFDRRNISEVDLPILQGVLCELAEIATVNKALRLMTCIRFLTSNKHMKIPTSLYPINFIDEVFRQVLSKSNENIHINFVFLVYRNFFKTLDDWKFLFSNSNYSERFLEIAASVPPSSVSNIEQEILTMRRQLERENLTANKANRPLEDNTRQTNTEKITSRVDNIQHERPSSNKLNKQANPTPGMNLKEVFEYYKSKGVPKYLKMLQELTDLVKKKYNDITMSFILLESGKENVNVNYCYCLFQEIIDFDPKNIQDFTNENITPARRLLVVIDCCLKTHHLKEAIDLFLKFGVHESEWERGKSPEDMGMRGDLCQDIEKSLLKLSKFTVTEAQLFNSIITHQKSLRGPVCLQLALDNFFTKAVHFHKEGGWSAIQSIALTILDENLFGHLSFGDETEKYRILIMVMCAENNANKEKAPVIGIRLMKKSAKFCDIYPHPSSLLKKESNEISLKTCLAVEELYTILKFKMRLYQEYIHSTSLFITFEECESDPDKWKLSYFRQVDCTLRGAIERFKTAWVRLGLGPPSSLIVNGNRITIDKVLSLNYTE